MTTPATPARHLRWELTGAGLDNLGLAEREVLRPGPNELLVRIDACGVCFSDIKILNLGGNHPRLHGRDLTTEPVVMGHETAMTVIEAGESLRDRFQPGQRYLIQADVYFQGQGMAFGYRQPGGYSQYQIIGPETLNGDEGCYLLPVSDRMSHAQAALCEPWACVEAAYVYQPRAAPKPCGKALVVFFDPSRLEGAAETLKQLGDHEVLTPENTPWLENPDWLWQGIETLRSEQPDGFDDILLYGMPSSQEAHYLATLLKAGGVFAIQGTGTMDPVALDIGSVHYRDHWYTGTAEGDPYAWGRTTELTPGGVAWFIGAGGPLGQMHIQRALALPQPPAKIIVTQNGAPRLEELRRRFAGAAGERGVELVLLDPREHGEGVYDLIRQESGGRGCDDIVVVVPNPEVTARAYEVLAPGGGLNVFAGLPVGTTAELDLSRIAMEGVRLWGTSGSKIADLRAILEKAEAGALPTDRVVAAVGGIGAVKAGLEAVRDGVFVGKTVIYPGCPDLPLTTVADLAEKHPTLKERLLDGRYWTPEAEAELLRLYGAG